MEALSAKTWHSYEVPNKPEEEQTRKLLAIGAHAHGVTHKARTG